MVEFMKIYFLKRILTLEEYCEMAFSSYEYPSIMNDLMEIETFSNTTNLVHKMEKGEINFSPYMFLNTRYPYIYQNIIRFTCLKLFKMGVFETFLLEQTFALTEMPDWNNYYVVSGLREDCNNSISSIENNIVRTIMKEAGWNMYEELIFVNSQYFDDIDSLYHDIMYQACQGFDKLKKVLQVAEKNHKIKEVITEIVIEEELEEINMLIFISDRNYSLELLSIIFESFINRQVEFYLNSVKAVILFFPSRVNEYGLDFTLDSTSYNIFSAIKAYYCSLIYPFIGIGMIE